MVHEVRSGNVGRTRARSSMRKLRSFIRAIGDHPSTSLQDGLLVCGAMIGATILTLEYDLFRFAGEMTTPERQITLRELIFLSAVLVIGIVAFIVRRLYEARRDAVLLVQRDLDIQRLREEAARDPLTGLPNRRSLLAALAAATAGPSQDGRHHAFFLLDLNDFKRVNDEHGHAIGDRVLRVVVERLKAASRPADLLARLGGDEFAVLAYDVDRDAAEALGQRYIASLSSAVSTDRTSHQVGVSIGCGLIPEHGVTPEEILADADFAMYQAKAEGRSAVVFCGGRTNATGQGTKVPSIAGS
jgi:diguanylate cyclase (GGDEF)-like protein